MEENVLVRTLGDTHLLKVLGFFLEHPVHQFKITTLSKYLALSRETVKNDLAIYEDFGYLVRASERGPYKLRLGSEMVQTLIKCTTRIAQTHLRLDDEIAAWEPSSYPGGAFAVTSVAMNIAGA